MKQSNRYVVGDLVKTTNDTYEDKGRWPRNTICVITDIFHDDDDGKSLYMLMAIERNQGRSEFTYYEDEITPYPCIADRIGDMTDDELSQMILNWLRSPYNAVNGK